MSPTTYPEIDEEVETPPATESSSQPQVHLQAGSDSVAYKSRQHHPEEGQHTARLAATTKGKKERTAYLAPSAQGTVAVIVRLEPELKDAVDKAVDESGLTQKEFLTAAIKKAVQGHNTETDPITAKMTAEALEKSRELEAILRRVNRSFDRHSR